jgi:hypothetical protein
VPLWAHRYGDGNLPDSGYESKLISGEFGLVYNRLLNQRSAEFISPGIDDDGRDVTLSEPNSRGPSAISNQHQLNDFDCRPTCSPLREELQGRPWTRVTFEHLPTPLFEHQLERWVYRTCNTEITFSERLEKLNWEPPCFAKL